MLVLTRKILNIEKQFDYESDGKRSLEYKTIYQKNKKTIQQYNAGGVVGSTRIIKWDKSNEITENTYYEYDKLVQKSTYTYKVEIEEKAKGRLQEFFKETTD